MKILSKKQIYQGDALTAKKQNITSDELMERSGVQIFNWMHMRMQGAQVPVHIFCGIGNNGGNGLVLARQLITHGYQVYTYIVNCGNERSDLFLVNYDRVKKVTKQWPELIKSETAFPKIHKDDIIVDAIFGIGLDKPIADWIGNLFHHFRASKAFTLAIDIPSGVYTDRAVDDSNKVVYANYTLSFQTPKLVFFLPETAKYTIQWEVIDIGIDREFLMTTPTEAQLMGKFEVLPMYKPREKFSHKGQFGHGLIVGGSFGKIGAVTLASKAVMSAGAGLVTAFMPKCGYQILQSSFPEAMVICDEKDNEISNIEYNFEPTAIGIGVGLGTSETTLKAFEDFLKQNKSQLVIDADAINLLAQNKNLLKLVPKQSILTPHPKELERLIGKWTNDFDKLKKVKAFSKENNLIVVLKGAHTITVFENLLYVNTSGNQGMATAGSGDVLTGVITGLLCQGYDALQASLFGVYLHGKSGDIAVGSFGYQSLIASHLIDFLGDAYLSLFERPEEPKEVEKGE